jgi:hypothetical protein
MRQSTVVIAGSLLAALACTSAAQPTIVYTPPARKPEGIASERKDPTNAALLYYRAWMLAGDDLFRHDYQTGDAAWRPDTALSQLLAASQEPIIAIIRATDAPEADWGVEYSQGIMAMLPHLGKLRQSARILSADARRLADAGDTAGAARRIAAEFGLASHCSHDNVLISSMVGCAVVTFAVNEIDALLESGKLSSCDKATLRAGLDRLGGDDPFGTRAAITGERFFCEWFQRECKDGAATRQVVDSLQLMPSSPEERARADRLVRLNEAGLRAEFVKAFKYYDDMAAAWDKPDARAELERLVQSREEYGLVAALIGPSITKAYESHQKALEALRACRRRLDADPSAPTTAKEP